MRIAVCLTLIFLPGLLQAGIYSPDQLFLFEIEPGNIAQEMQYSGGFDTQLADFRDINVPDNRLKLLLEERIRKRRLEGVNRLSPDELAGYTADLLRVNRGDEVLNLLHPIARDPRRGGFLVYTHLARAHAARGEWREAAEQELMAVKYSDFPTKFGQLSRDQLAWLKKVEKDYYLPWLLKRAEEARLGKVIGLNENPDRIFPAGGKSESDFVKFTSGDGGYQAGKIAESEKAKLPPDALAIVQQMLIWHPNDARLLWQLGELYNTEGNIDTAARILDLGSYTQGYSNPQLLDHRRVLLTAISEAAAAKVAEQEAERAAKIQNQIDEKKRFWWIVSIFVAGGIFLLYSQAREIRRRIMRWF
ncbi:hypothetical protein [Zavarzinella formosa]|uniref:hypothetical protein n=1 Tax=Zavarzinella formosa TaxID=360055 RepID=UPI0003658ED4|nr:hypothetical protein [Zavarzinella formosa]